MLRRPKQSTIEVVALKEEEQEQQEEEEEDDDDDWPNSARHNVQWHGQQRFSSLQTCRVQICKKIF